MQCWWPHAAHTGMHTPHFTVFYLLDPTMILLLKLRFLAGKCKASSGELCVHTLPILITCKFLRKRYDQIVVIWNNKGLGRHFLSWETRCVTALRQTAVWVASSSRFPALQEADYFRLQNDTRLAKSKLEYLWLPWLRLSISCATSSSLPRTLPKLDLKPDN